MKKNSFFIGVDVSKLTLDVAIINGVEPNSMIHSCFSNSKTGISELLSWVKKNSSKVREELIFCMEHTGVYALPLCSTLSENKLIYTLVPALEIQRSSGMQRGKSDAADAKMIAKYLYLRRDNIKITTVPDKALLKLRHLISYRERIVRCKVMFDNTKDTTLFSDKDCIQSVRKETKQMVSFLNKQIERLNQQLEAILKEDPVTKRQYELITSIPGIGLQIAANVIAYTRAFSCFDDPRKFACYSGIAPFPYQSGSSIRGRNKVNHMANKKLKSLLSMSALLVVRNDAEMRLYYERKVKDGKNKMLVLNAIRNKVVQRIFAVIKRDSPFVPLSRHAA